MFLTVKLSEIVARLSSDDVRVLAYKGPVSAIQAYGNLSLRQFGDLDVLVDEAEYGRARERLEAYGYRAASDWGWECSFDDASQMVRVDLHRNVTPDRFPLALDFGRLWERREYVPVLKRQIPTLCAEHALVVLAIQLAKDSLNESPMKLSKVCDIAELIRSQPSLDWRLVESTSSNLGCRRVVEVGLGVTTRLLGPLPGRIAIDLGARSRRARLEEHTISRLFGAEDPASKRPMSGVSFHLAIRERWRDKSYPLVLDVSSRLKPNERDFALVSLPTSLRYLYHLVRPVRLARDYIVRLLSRRA